MGIVQHQSNTCVNTVMEITIVPSERVHNAGHLHILDPYFIFTNYFSHATHILASLVNSLQSDIICLHSIAYDLLTPN